MLLWGDDYHPIDYSSLVKHHREKSSPLTMTVTTEHECMNLHHESGRLIQYSKQQEPPPTFNGYEAGTSIVSKSVVLEHGKDGPWSWENTIYSAMANEIHVHLDSTKFWDMGTPERLEKLEQFFNESSL